MDRDIFTWFVGIVVMALAIVIFSVVGIYGMGLIFKICLDIIIGLLVLFVLPYFIGKLILNIVEGRK